MRCLVITGGLALAVILMTPHLTNSQNFSAEIIAKEPRVAKALEWIEKNGNWITQQQVKITEVPAPEFHEEARAQLVQKILESSGIRSHLDAAGNLVAEFAGRKGNGVVVVAAHLDTVFPAGTNVQVRQKGKRLEAPGIGDNGAGLATLVAIARALHESKVRTESTVLLAADVGEEGEGNLRGMRALVDEYGGQLRTVIAVDGYSTDYVTTRALGSRRVEVTITGPGGHSWSDFGRPNPITAIARGVVRFSAVRVPTAPRTTFNVGVIQGGTSVNSIPQSASVLVDIRSEDDSEIRRMETALHKAFQRGASEEEDASGNSAELTVQFRVVGTRPSGVLPEDSPLLAGLRSVDAFLGNASREEVSSTDANIPLSLGIPALAIGGGGEGGGAHTLHEWYDVTGRELGVKRVLLTVLAAAGVAS